VTDIDVYHCETSDSAWRLNLCVLAAQSVQRYAHIVQAETDTIMVTVVEMVVDMMDAALTALVMVLGTQGTNTVVGTGQAGKLTRTMTAVQW